MLPALRLPSAFSVLARKRSTDYRALLRVLDRLNRRLLELPQIKFTSARGLGAP
jgi:hypothetical protein